jgi:hypothetical protein
MGGVGGNVTMTAKPIDGMCCVCKEVGGGSANAVKVHWGWGGRGFGWGGGGGGGLD